MSVGVVGFVTNVMVVLMSVGMFGFVTDVVGLAVVGVVINGGGGGERER